MNVPIEMRKEIESTLYYCNKYGFIEHVKYLKINKKGFQDWLWGKICFIYSVNEELGKKYIKQYNKINWTI